MSCNNLCLTPSHRVVRKILPRRAKFHKRMCKDIILLLICCILLGWQSKSEKDL